MSKNIFFCKVIIVQIKLLDQKYFLESDKKLLNLIKLKISNFKNMMNEQDINGYIKSVIEISFSTNKYINDTEPWKLKKIDKERMNAVLFVSLEQIAYISILLNPIIPNSTSLVLNALGLPKDLWNLQSINDNKIFINNITIKKLEILFKKFN